MPWRRRHCCRAAAAIWGVKRSLFRSHAAGLLSLASLLGLLFLWSPHDWLQGRTGHGRDSPVVTYTVRGLRQPQRSEANPAAPPNGSTPQQGSVTGLQDALGANGTSGGGDKGAGGWATPQPYPYILNEPDKCREQTPFLVLLIAAEPGQAEARDAIRRTWGNHSTVALGLGFVRLFLLGVGSGPASQQHAIEEESRRHRDIVQQEYRDTYYNLTIKTLMGMHWVATHCPDAAYVMKTDSDMFVNTEYLIHKLLRPELPPRRGYFTGYLMRGYAPNRNKDSKWYMPPELYPSERYPVFCSGTGYVFSADLAPRIYSASLGIRRLHLEDVYVGICLAKLRVDPVPPPNEFIFNHWRVSYSSCKYSHLVTSHQFQPVELLKYWSHLQSNKHNACTNGAKDKAPRYRHRSLHWRPRH